MKKTAILACFLSMMLVAQAFHLAFAAWEVDRPDEFDRMKHFLSNATTDGRATIGLGMTAYDFDPQPLGYPPNRVALNLSAICNTREGIDYTCDDGSGQFSWVKDSDLNAGQGGDVVPLTGDNNGTWVRMPLWHMPFRFYGGAYMYAPRREMSGIVVFGFRPTGLSVLTYPNLTIPVQHRFQTCKLRTLL